MTLRIALFTLASEVFREQADKDYIVARSCYRMNLREQFLWSSLQACEKYLKGILLFNERSARYDPASYNPLKTHNKEFGHDLTRLFTVVLTIADLPLSKPDWLPRFLKYLTAFGNNRYLSKATYATGDELRRLDEAVWVLRRACQNFDWTPNVNGSPKNLRPVLLAQSSRQENRKTPALYRPFGAGGYLEKTLKASKSDSARQALVWKNMFLGNRQRHRVSYTQFSSSENPPQTREWFSDPAITGKIDHYVRLT
jgi:HEPN domain-containing protein